MAPGDQCCLLQGGGGWGWDVLAWPLQRGTSWGAGGLVRVVSPAWCLLSVLEGFLHEECERGRHPETRQAAFRTHKFRNELTSPKKERKKESEVAQSYLTLCDAMDCSPPGSSMHGIFQARILGWVAVSFSRGSSWLRNGTWLPPAQRLLHIQTFHNKYVS